jgi:hypothetical protein
MGVNPGSVIRTIAVLIIGMPTAFLILMMSFAGLEELVYSISGIELGDADSILEFFVVIAIFVSFIYGPWVVYEYGKSGERVAPLILAVALSVAIISLVMLGFYRISKTSDVFQASPLAIIVSGGLGLACTLALYSVGRLRAPVNNADKNKAYKSNVYQPSKPLPPKSSPAFSRTSNAARVVRPFSVSPGVWASIAGLGAFCGILASIYLGNIMLQLMLALIAAAAAGIVAYIQLKK